VTLHISTGLVPAALSILILAVIPTTQVTIPTTITISPPGIPHFNYILTIVFENEGLDQTYGSHCPGNCTYITQLANTYGLAENYLAIAHPSLPNYLALTSGGNYDIAPFNTDCGPTSAGCQISAPNIIDSIEASGRTWKAYMEDYNGGCSHAGTLYYHNNHNPFLYYTDISTNLARCSRIVDANPGASGYLALPTRLLADLNSTTTSSNYMWLTPNLCDDGHTLCAPLNNTITQVNNYLSLLVPQILNSTLFKSQQATLLITWDESSIKTPNRVTTIWAGNTVKTGYKSLSTYDHYSTARTIETAWTLPTLAAYDSNAKPMTEFFLT
jgi:phosphatidylinositol-3-phosphatase